MGEKSKTNTNSQFNLWNRVKNALIGAAMADQPAVMTASGWRQNENGDYIQDQQNDPGVKQLRENISILSGTADGEAGIIGLNFGKGLIKNANKGKQITKLISKQIDNTTPVIKELPLNVGWGPKQVIHGKHASNSPKALTLYNPERYDVVYEGANPFGVWYQGKLGVPRTAATNSIPGKAEKAQRARELFANRPHMHEGAVILEKPITTVGDVPDRSKLSRIAEQLGSDGIVYNDVYDNGFSNNQVIHSFKLHIPQHKKGNIIKLKSKYNN